MRTSLHLEGVIQRLLPLAALLGGPCCGSVETTSIYRPWSIPRDAGVAVPDDGGRALTLDECDRLCRAADRGVEVVYGCTMRSSPAPPGTDLVCDVKRSTCMDGAGRRPAGLVDEAAAPGGDAVGDHLAELARLEAASVRAFLTLRDELTLHGAPARLVRAATRAARDEVRHARQMARLARLHGAPPRRAVVRPVAPRSLEAVALENAVEGCVHETWGALLASWQVRSAGNPRAREVLRGVARDEARHAELAWEVAAWAEPKLAPDDRASVSAARRGAFARLRAAVRDDARPEALVRELGYPCPSHAAALVDGLLAELAAR